RSAQDVPASGARRRGRDRDGPGVSEHGPAGTLYVVATPIGNLEDITLRVLREASVIAAEDTRSTRKLLAHHGLAAPKIVSCFTGNEVGRGETLLDEV